MTSGKNFSFEASGGGVGFLGLLGLVFITLKLCGVINWSWWLVLLPIYGPVCLVIGLFLLLFLLTLVVAGFVGFISFFTKK